MGVDMDTIAMVATILFGVVITAVSIGLPMVLMKASRDDQRSIDALTAGEAPKTPPDPLPPVRPCARCGGVEAWVIDEVSQPADDSINVANPMRVHAFQQGLARMEVGSAGAHVCVGCGQISLFARGANEGLAALASRPDTGVRRARA